MKSQDDKLVEEKRYDDRAAGISDSDCISAEAFGPVGANTVELTIREPYRVFEDRVLSVLTKDKVALEIGAGTGEFTMVAVQSAMKVVALDISRNSLELLKQRYSTFNNLETQKADMECLPFEAEQFDVVISAGSLSYGDNETVMNEIYRVLKFGGDFICVDSLNHNPIYVINRWIHFLRGSRTKSTLVRMPRLSLIESYKKKFGSCEVEFFGAIVWTSPMLKLFGGRVSGMVVDGFDRIFKTKKSAFKFVMCVKKVK